MGMVRLATVVLVLIAVPVFAESVTYQLQLGGDNHATAVRGGSRIMYTPGLSTPDQVFAPGVLNWAATLAVSGTHSTSPGQGLATQGIANFVFSLELHQGTEAGPLVNNADFYSNIHDGSGGLDCSSCAGGGGFCAGSAFAISYNVTTPPRTQGPARIIEAYYFGGPFMDVCMWPTVPTASGKILGTGAGYSQWCRGLAACGLGGITTKGVGVTGGLGVVPVVEGQINTAGLALGTYVLKLVPGAGTNVLRGDVDLTTDKADLNSQVQAFAVATDTAVPSTSISFVVGSIEPLLVNSMVSIKTHGNGVGDLGIDLSSKGVEPRTGGPTKLVVTFSEAIQTTVVPANVSITSGSVSSVSAVGSVLTVDLSGVADQTAVTIGFPGIKTLAGGVTCNETKCFHVLSGDANGDLAVNIFDLRDIRLVLDQTVDATTVKYDVNADGALNIFDLRDTRLVLDNAIATQCP